MQIIKNTVKTRVYFNICMCYVRASISTNPMAIVASQNNKHFNKASQYFQHRCAELKLDKYKLTKYKKLFELASFQNMHDADLAYHYVYTKCADNAWSKPNLSTCLEQLVLLTAKNACVFNGEVYNQYINHAAKEIQQQIHLGELDHLF